MKINKEQLAGLLRQAFTFLLTIIAGKFFKDDQIIAGLGFVLAEICVIGWGVWHKQKVGLSVWASLARHMISVASGVIPFIVPAEYQKQTLGFIGTVGVMLGGVVVASGGSAEANAEPNLVAGKKLKDKPNTATPV